MYCSVFSVQCSLYNRVVDLDLHPFSWSRSIRAGGYCVPNLIMQRIVMRQSRVRFPCLLTSPLAKQRPRTAGINYLVVYAGSLRGICKIEMQEDGSTSSAYLTHKYSIFFVTNCHFQYWKDKRKRTKAVQSALKGDFHLYLLTCIPANFWHFFLVGRVRRQLLLQCLPFNVFRDVWIGTLRAVTESMCSSPYL